MRNPKARVRLAPVRLSPRSLIALCSSVPRPYFPFSKGWPALLLSPHGGGRWLPTAPRATWRVCLSFSFFNSLVPGKESLIGQVLRGLGSNKNGSVVQQVRVSTPAVRRTDTLKDVDHNLRTSVPILGERGLTAASKPPLFCDLLSVTCYLGVLERRDSAEWEDSRDFGLEKSAPPRFNAFPCPPHSRCSFQLAELIHTPPCLMTLISAKEEPKQEAPKEEKAHPPWAPPLQHNFLKNWQRNIALRKKQQETLSGEQSGQGSCLASYGIKALLLCFFSPSTSRTWIQADHICAEYSQVLLALSGS